MAQAKETEITPLVVGSDSPPDSPTTLRSGAVKLNRLKNSSEPLFESAEYERVPEDRGQQLADHLLHFSMKQLELSVTPILQRSKAEIASFSGFLVLKILTSIPVSAATAFFYNLTAIQASIYLRQQLQVPVPSWLQHWLFFVAGAKQNIEVNIVGNNIVIDKTRRFVSTSIDKIGDPHENALITDYSISRSKRILIRSAKASATVYLSSAAASVSGILSYSERAAGSAPFDSEEQALLWTNVAGAALQLVVGVDQGLFPNSHPADYQVILNDLRTQKKIWLNLCKDSPAEADRRMQNVYSLYRQYKQDSRLVTAAQLIVAMQRINLNDYLEDKNGRTIVNLLFQHSLSTARRRFTTACVFIGVLGVLGYPLATGAGTASLIGSSANATLNNATMILTNATTSLSPVGEIAAKSALWSVGFISALIPFLLLSWGSGKIFGENFLNPQETVNSLAGWSGWMITVFGLPVATEFLFALFSGATNQLVDTQEIYRLLSFFSQTVVDESSLPARILANTYGLIGYFSAITTNYVFPYWAMKEAQTFCAEHINAFTKDNGCTQRFIKFNNTWDKIVNILDELPRAHADAIIRHWFEPKADGTYEPIAVHIAALWMETLSTEQKLGPAQRGMITQEGIANHPSLRQGLKVEANFEIRDKKPSRCCSWGNPLNMFRRAGNTISNRIWPNSPESHVAAHDGERAPSAAAAGYGNFTL